jgi:hypothetical protein
MANVFSNTPPEDDEEDTPGLRVAGALTGGDGEEEPSEEAPQASKPQGIVDSSAQPYMIPADADEDGEPTSEQPPASSEPVSADTAAYMTPIAPPTLAKPQAFADHSADQAAMVTQKQRESQENIRPSIGRRILAGLSGGAVAFGGGDGAAAIRRIEDRPAQDAQRHWAQEEAPLQAQLNADQAADAATTRANTVTEQGNKLAETNYSNQIRGQQDAARAQNYAAQAAARNEGINGDGWEPDDPDNPLGGYSGTSVGGKTLHSTTAPKSVQLDPEYKIAAAKAAGTPFTTEQQQILRSGGKLTFRPPPNPRQPTEGEAALRAATAAFTKENGRPPQTLDEQNRVIQASKGTLGGPAGQAGPGEKIAQNMQDKQSYIDSLTENKDDVKDEQGNILSPKGALVDKAGNTVSRQQFNDRLEKFRTDLNADPVMRKSGTMVDPQGNTVTNRFSRNPQSAPAATPAQSAPKPPRTPAKGLPDNTAARNPRTGKIEWLVKGGTWTPAQP